MKHSFYFTREWKTVRYMALRDSNGWCRLCGRTAKDGIKLHVDHIRPVSKEPKLALMLSNLQVLCDECNIGKSNTDNIDWSGQTVLSDKQRRRLIRKSISILDTQMPGARSSSPSLPNRAVAREIVMKQEINTFPKPSCGSQVKSILRKKEVT